MYVGMQYIILCMIYVIYFMISYGGFQFQLIGTFSSHSLWYQQSRCSQGSIRIVQYDPCGKDLSVDSNK